MDESLHNEEALLRYLDGEMTPEERGRFERAMEGDMTLRRRVEALQLAIEGLQQVGTAQRVRQLHTEMMSELRGVKKESPVRHLVRRSLSVAAVIIVLFLAIGGWWFSRLSSANIYSEHYIDYSIGTTRGGEAPVSAFTTLYQAHNYAAIIQAAPTASLSAQDSLLTGLAFLQTGSTEEAVRWFNALQSAAGPYRQDAEYYLAMAYIRQGRAEKAEPLLQQIRANKQHLYNEQVSGGLLWKVRMLQWK